MSHTPIDYYQSFDSGRTEVESPATIQDSRIAASYSVARMDGMHQSNEYLTPNSMANSSEADQIMQNTGTTISVNMDNKPSINAALAVAMLQNGEMTIDNNHLTGLLDNQNSAAAAAAAAALVAASSSVQPQSHQNALQSLSKPMALRNNQPQQHPPSSDGLIQSQQRGGGYVQQQTTVSASQLQAPMGAVMSSIHGIAPSGSPSEHTIQISGQLPQVAASGSGGMDNSNVHGVIDELQDGGTSNQIISNNGGAVIPPVSMPTSVIKVLSGSSQQRPRSEKKPIPEDLKDDKYFERRKRNNMAAKKSRDARKQREDEIAIRASFLEKENAILRAQVATLRDEANSLRQLLLAKRTNRT